MTLQKFSQLNQQSKSVNMSAAAVIAPLTYLPIYIQLLSMTKRNCQAVPPSETTLTEVCTSLLAGVTKFKSELDSVKDLLPTTAQMKELKDVAWTFPTTNATTQASKMIINLILGTAAQHQGILTKDEDPGSLFSQDRLSVLKKHLKEETLPELTEFDEMDLIMQTLIQARLTRIEGAEFYRWSQIMLVVIICPQLLTFSFIVIQFALLKKREHKLRRNTMRVSRERSLMQSLLAEMRGNQFQEERPAAVVSHL